MENSSDLVRRIGDRMRGIFKSYLGYAAVALVCVFYVATAFLSVEATGKSISEIIADGAVAFLLGISINRMLDAQGIRNGADDARVRGAEEKHAALVEEVAPYLDELELFCEEKNREAQARARKTYLSHRGYRYADYFDADGICVRTHLPHGAGLRARMRALRERMCVGAAARLHLTRLSAGLLISDAGNPNDPYFLGRSKREYRRTSSRSDVISKLLTATVFGYYGVSLLQSFSVANFLWTLFQVVLFLLMGGIKMERSYLYVTDEYRARISKKTDILRMFTLYKAQKEDEDGSK